MQDICLTLGREVDMGKVPPIYSAKETDRVYHADNQCTERNNIERENVRQGTGGRPKCKRCIELSG